MPDSHTNRPGEDSSAERQRLLDRLHARQQSLPLAALRRVDRTQDILAEVKATSLATFIKVNHPELSDSAIAYMVDVHRTTLHRNDEYGRLKELLTAKSKPTRGAKNRNGSIEAWDADDPE